MPQGASVAIPGANSRSAIDTALQVCDATYAVQVIRSRRTGQVLCLEAGKDFIDTLLSFLLLPVGTIIHMLLTGLPEAKHFSSLSSIFKSLEKMDSALLHVDKNYVLAQPRPAVNNRAGLCKATASTGLLQLCLDADAKDQTSPKTMPVMPGTFFKCDSCNLLSSVAGEECGICSPKYRPHKPFLFGIHCYSEGPYSLCSAEYKRQYPNVAGQEPEQEPVEEYNRSTGPGFVMEHITFMVTDNLEIMPATTTESMRLLNALKVTSLADLESEKTTVTIIQVLQLLRSALSSSTCLNDVFKSGVRIESSESSRSNS